jgi:nucleoside-diphosphate-sugar epimerase
MTTLVTGASGTVGRSLVSQLVRAGEPVRAMTRDPAAARFPAGVQVVHGDLADPGPWRPRWPAPTGCTCSPTRRPPGRWWTWPDGPGCGG